MKKLLIIILLLLVIGCDTPLTNEQIVETTKYCKENDMDITIMEKVETGEIIKITCLPISLWDETL